MPVSLFTPHRTVLLIADEALHLYSTSMRGVELVESVPWGAENFERHVSDIISKDCNKRPVLILNDMVEQHYRKEKVLRRGVNVLDKPAMITRKLNVAFPNYPVKAYFPLKEKVAARDKAQAADVYIFAAIPGTEQFSKTVSSVKRSLAAVSGFCMLPVESSDLVKALSAKVSKTAGRKSKWAVFMGQHKNGGLRQIVTKNGELALTRMTMITEDVEDSTRWASEVHQEFESTMSYLSRFGYHVNDGLDVMVVGGPEAGDHLEGLIEEECNYASFTLPQAAKLLGLPVGGGYDSGNYADILHIAWVARKSSFILPMRSAQLDQVSKPRKVATFVSLGLLCSAAFLGYQMFGQYALSSDLKERIGDATQRQSQLNVQYQKEVKRKEDLGFDIRLIQGAVTVADELESRHIDYLPILNSIGHALGRDMRLDTVDIGFSNEVLDIRRILPQSTNRELDDVMGVPYTVTMYMTYPGTTDIDTGNAEIRDFKERLQTLMPNHKVNISKYLKDYEYVEELVLDSGNMDEEERVKQDFVAELKISGVTGHD